MVLCHIFRHSIFHTIYVGNQRYISALTIVLRVRIYTHLYNTELYRVRHVLYTCNMGMVTKNLCAEERWFMRSSSITVGIDTCFCYDWLGLVDDVFYIWGQRSPMTTCQKKTRSFSGQAKKIAKTGLIQMKSGSECTTINLLTYCN